MRLRYARLKSTRLRCLGEKFRVEKSWVEISVVEKFWVEKCRVYVQRGSRVELFGEDLFGLNSQGRS